MSTRQKSQGDVGRRDVLKLLGAAGAVASPLPLVGSALAEETVVAAADKLHHHVIDASKSHAGVSGYELQCR